MTAVLSASTTLAPQEPTAPASASTPNFSPPSSPQSSPTRFRSRALNIIGGGSNHTTTTGNGPTSPIRDVFSSSTTSRADRRSSRTSQTLGKQKEKDSSDDDDAAANSHATPLSTSPIRTFRPWRLVHVLTKNQPKTSIYCSSGDAPKTHPDIANLDITRKEDLVRQVCFTCRDAVDAVKLLSIIRRELFVKAESRGGNCLVDEEWTYQITGQRRTFKITIKYRATTALCTPPKSALSSSTSSSTYTTFPSPDPRKPPSLDCANGTPGLMTVLSREDEQNSATTSPKIHTKGLRSPSMGGQAELKRVESATA